MSEKLKDKKCLYCEAVIPAPYSLRYDQNWLQRKYCNDACRRAGNRANDNRLRNERRRRARSEARKAQSRDAKRRLELMDARTSQASGKSGNLWALVAEMHPEFLPMLALGPNTTNNYDPVFLMDRSINS